jgi:hypothetical protein
MMLAWFVFAAFSGLQERLQGILDDHSAFFNCSFSFAVHNETTELALTSGANNYGTPTTSRLTPDNQIPVGSTTKMYTAVAVMRLAEVGIIQLDQPVAPLVDRYLAKPMTCDQAPLYCAAECAPISHCLVAPKPDCSAVTQETNLRCSYCLRFLHCFPGEGRPTAVSVLNLWKNDTRIENVTFRHILSMNSGLRDYYDTPGGNEWLYYAVLNSTRDVEPLEYLVEQDKSFLFSPGEETIVPAGQPGAGQTVRRGAYSTNAYSLIGLALAGLFDLDDWAQLDQRLLSWGEALPEDDATLFPTRGTCLSYGSIAHQYTSRFENETFVDISNHSCLNSWMGGNIAPRPLDVARFTFAAFRNDSKALISEASLAQMADFAPLTEEFGQYIVAYGLGLEGRWDGIGVPLDVCGFLVIGHGGQDYGSGSLIQGYMPQFRMGVSMAITSGFNFGAGIGGMNCSRPYANLLTAGQRARSTIMHALAEAAGLTTYCKPTNWTVPSASECADAPKVGTLNGQDFHCSDLLNMTAHLSPPLSANMACNNWMSVRTLAMLAKELPGYMPPAGVDPTTTTALAMCLGSCGDVGVGPCWLRQPIDTPWC